LPDSPYTQRGVHDYSRHCDDPSVCLPLLLVIMMVCYTVRCWRDDISRSRCYAQCHGQCRVRSLRGIRSVKHRGPLCMAQRWPVWRSVLLTGLKLRRKKCTSLHSAYSESVSCAEFFVGAELCENRWHNRRKY